jgi:hypothetical protein
VRLRLLPLTVSSRPWGGRELEPSREVRLRGPQKGPQGPPPVRDGHRSLLPTAALPNPFARSPFRLWPFTSLSLLWPSSWAVTGVNYFIWLTKPRYFNAERLSACHPHLAVFRMRLYNMPFNNWNKLCGIIWKGITELSFFKRRKLRQVVSFNVSWF